MSNVHPDGYFDALNGIEQQQTQSLVEHVKIKGILESHAFKQNSHRAPR